MNVAFHWSCTPGQSERGLHCCLAGLQLGCDVMERGFAGGLSPRQPSGCIALPHHAVEPLGYVGAGSDVGTQSAQGLREGLLGWRWIVNEAEQKRAGLPRTGWFPGRGERTPLRTPAHPQADPEPAAQRDCGKRSSLGPQFAPELATIVTAFGPTLL
jgi:hypothetical protein